MNRPAGRICKTPCDFSGREQSPFHWARRLSSWQPPPSLPTPWGHLPHLQETEQRKEVNQEGCEPSVWQRLRER